MRWISGTITVGTSGTEEQISGDSAIEDEDLVYSIIFKARARNAGFAYIRESTNATAAVGWELSPGESSPSISPHLIEAQPSASLTGILASSFYVDVETSGDIVDYLALIR